MSVAVERHLDIGMPGDGLKCFYINAGRSGQCDIGVSEGMRRCSVKVNSFADALPHARESPLSQWFFSIADDKAAQLTIRAQNFREQSTKRDDAKTGVAFCFADDRLIVVKGDGYSKEELVAEIGAATLVNHVGLETSNSFRNNTA